MFVFLFAASLSAIEESAPLITQELVDSINNDPSSTFKATLYPKFASMTVGDAKKFLSPVRPSPKNHGSARPIGANEQHFNKYDRHVVTGLTTDMAYSGTGFNYDDTASKPFYIPIFDITNLCASWSSAVTSAMSISVSRWNNKFVNFSQQFIMDCDILGDPCAERPPLSAYQQFWKRRVPQNNRWDQPYGTQARERKSPLGRPVSSFNQTICESTDYASGACYPGTKNCARDWALTGDCSESSTYCPIYFLYNWRWIKSHLWEVGAVTSSILVTPSFFTYGSGVYSIKSTEDILGMLDVTIIGWGQSNINLSVHPSATNTLERFWYVIPHLGCTFGLKFKETLHLASNGVPTNPIYRLRANPFATGSDCKNDDSDKGIMKINRRFDDSLIESQAVGAAPFNFVPMPYRTPKATWQYYHSANN